MSGLTVNPSYLEDLILETGGTLHRKDGSVLNASGTPVGYRKPKKAAVQQETAAPAPQQVGIGGPELANALAELARKIQPQVQAAPVVNVPEPQVVIQPAAKVSWRFEFERNSDKTIKAIIAKPL